MNPKGTKGVVTNFAVRVDFAPVEPVDQIMLELLTEGQPKVRTPNSGKKALVVLHDVILNPPAISLGIYDGLVNTVELFEKVGLVYISIDQRVPAKPVLRWQPGLPQRLYVELSRRSVCQRLGDGASALIRAMVAPTVGPSGGSGKRTWFCKAV